MYPYVCIRMYVCICMCIHMYGSVCIYSYVCMYLYLYLYVYLYVCIRMYVRICMYASVCVSKCICIKFLSLLYIHCTQYHIPNGRELTLCMSPCPEVALGTHTQLFQQRTLLSLNEQEQIVSQLRLHPANPTNQAQLTATPSQPNKPGTAHSYTQPTQQTRHR